MDGREGEGGWNKLEISGKMFLKECWMASSLQKIQTEKQKKRGRGTEVGGWPSVHKPEAMKHYARIMKMVLLGHTPHYRRVRLTPKCQQVNRLGISDSFTLLLSTANTNYLQEFCG